MHQTDSCFFKTKQLNILFKINKNNLILICFLLFFKTKVKFAKGF